MLYIQYVHSTPLNTIKYPTHSKNTERSMYYYSILIYYITTSTVVVVIYIRYPFALCKFTSLQHNNAETVTKSIKARGFRVTLKTFSKYK